MVVHSPVKSEAQRLAEAAASTSTPAPASSSGVPPSVAAASASGMSSTPVTGDLLGAWGTQPDVRVQAEVHAVDERDREGMSQGAIRRRVLTSDADEDKISIAGDADGVPPPATGIPPPAANVPPGLNPFTPEWFAQVINAAATTAATAAATAVANNTGRQSSPAQTLPPSS